MATANLGRVGFVNKGTYSGATAYKVNDVVVYNSGTYACIQANTGQAPTNTSYWQNWVVDNAVHKTGDETIAGVKTFSSSPISSATQSTAVNALTRKDYVDGLVSSVVHKTGNETIADVKTFSSSPIVPTPTIVDQAANKYYVDNKYSGFKNYIINGNFDVWQYGTSQTNDGYGSDDRWGNSNLGSTKTHSRVSCTDLERGLFNASYFSRTVVTSVAGNGNFIIKSQNIEDVTRLAGKMITLSFWARADSNKNISLSWRQNFGTGGSQSTQITGQNPSVISLTSSWQKYIINVNIPSTVGKTLGTDGVHTSFTQLSFIFDAGLTVATGWNVPTLQQSGTFDIAQVQLEEGSVATPFEQRPYGLELSLCQRYYEVGDLAVLRTSATAGTYGGGVTTLSYKQTKRVAPTVTPTITSSGGNPVLGYSTTTTSYKAYFVSSTNVDAWAGVAFVASAEL